jgi:hypothetical protein
MPRLTRLRRLPWLLVFEAARVTGGHLMQVTSPADRRRLREMLKSSKGLPQNLTERDRADLRRIARQLDPGGLARELGPSLLSGRRRHR